ncbi:MAG: hypothetical protein L3I91_01295 [Mycoplasma sp.]
MNQPTENKSVNIAKWPKYLFQLANVIVVIGAILALGIFLKQNDSQYIRTPVLVCNIIGIVASIVFLFFETRTITPLRFHTRAKWFKLILIDVLLYSLMILASVLLVYILKVDTKITLIINVALTAVWSLILIGIYSYARFQIHKEILMRRDGKNSVDPENTKALNKAYDDLTKPTIKQTDETDLIGKEATSGIYDESKK